MSENRTLLDTVHEATHRVPGVPDHVDRPAGHQGTTRHSGTAHASTGGRGHHGRTPLHSPTRAPRVLVAWQRRIAALFGQEPR